MAGGERMKIRYEGTCIVGVLVWAMSLWGVPAWASPCLPPKQAEAQVKAVEKANQRRYQAALRQRGMEPVTLQAILGPRGDDVGMGGQGDRVGEVPWGGRSVMAVTVVSSTACNVQHDFARQGSKIFRVERQARPGPPRTLQVCGAPPQGEVCGGARVVNQLISFVLPPGTTFAGTVSVEYEEQQVSMVPDRPMPPPQQAP